jgi:hypothetical protein
MNMDVKTVASDSRSFSYQEKMTVKWHVPDAAHVMSRKLSLFLALALNHRHRPDANLQAPPEGYRGDRVSPLEKKILFHGVLV